MFSYFLPDLYINSIYDLPLQELKEKKINTLIFDIDNTIVSYDTKAPSDLEINYIKKLIDEGFKVALLSNNNKKRVTIFNKDLKLAAIHRAVKPLGYGIKKVLRQLEANTHSTAIVGDQIFTDIWCGKRTGIYTILVSPLSVEGGFIIKLKRKLEKKVLEKI